MDEICKMENTKEDIYACPSFNSYSSDRLAEIAGEVAAEENTNDAAQGDHSYDDEDFEFTLVSEGKEVSAEDFAGDGRIGPIFPVFNRDLLRYNDGGNSRLESRIAVPLGKLFIEDRDGDDPQSCSSSEADELESVPAGTYCVWRPKAAEQPSPSHCKKSKSTGSASKRWKFRDLLRRSNSEGKDSFVFLTPKNREEKLSPEIPKKAKAKVGGGGGGSAAVRTGGSLSAHEALYVRNRAVKEGDRKKSYLPYRQDLVGFFVNVNVNNSGKSYLHF
ncbi:hypothetical protein ABFS82_08G011400 [Erythranthe guttata]|nr:PREDICTED: uncharacterized protein LOC105970703 [Erythranthe guttata]|eukprot:XP_012850992.1 PREDICTED: uncharacterized protein LOC105970703 [Erythranthe guttata]